MTALLRDAFGRLARLPREDQEFYARQLIQELEADERWTDLFDHTTDDEWEQVVTDAKQEAAQNGTLSLSELKGLL